MKIKTLHKISGGGFVSMVIKQIRKLGHEDIQDTLIQEKLNRILKWLTLEVGTVLRDIYVKQQLQSQLLFLIRYFGMSKQSAVPIIVMLYLCPNTVIDEIPLSFHGEYKNIQFFNDGQSEAMINLIKPLQKLPTKAYVVEGFGFESSATLDSLFKKMINLTQIALHLHPHSTVDVLSSLKNNCKHLESFTLNKYSETSEYTTLNEKDIFEFITGKAISVEEAVDILPDIKCQIPKLKHFDIGECFPTSCRAIYTLLMLIHPIIESVGNCFDFYYKDIKCFIDWSKDYLRTESVLPLKKLNLREPDILYVHESTEYEFFKENINVLSNVNSLNLNNMWSDNILIRVIKLFIPQLEALSIYDFPLQNVNLFPNLKHLQLANNMYIFCIGDINLILDECPLLHTLSILSKIGRESQRHQNERNIDVSFEELEALNRGIINSIHDDAAEDQQAGLVPQPNRRPLFQRISKKPIKQHNLRAFKLPTRMHLKNQECKVGLLELFRRLLNLQYLCFGYWIGADLQSSSISCSVTATFELVALHSPNLGLLRNLNQICGFPAAPFQDAVDNMFTLASCLKKLTTLVMPNLGSSQMELIRKLFYAYNVDIQHKCNIDQVFPKWEPYH